MNDASHAEPPPPPVSPRIQSLDTVRGVAVMGILLLNILGFAMPEAAYMNPRGYGGWHGADLATYLINFVLFDGKMRGLFSFLFGASLLLIIERATASGRSPARTHYARMAWLLVFGLAHLWLVWKGDILAHYALIGMIAFAFRNMAVPRLLVIAILLAALGTLIFASLPATIWFLLHAAGPASAERTAQLLEFTNGFGVPAPGEIARELALMRGDYAAILTDRFTHHQFTPVMLLFLYGPETLAYMLFGMAGLKSGFLRGAWAPQRYRKWLLVCWGIALPAYVLIAAYLLHAQFNLFAVALGMALATPFRPLMIAGWACLIQLLARRAGPLAQRIAATGRMAFSNYLLTSLICTTLFYGYGFGWFGHLSRWQLYPLVFAIWAAMLLWSKPWLARYRFGPLEWLWRSLARGSFQPLRGEATT